MGRGKLNMKLITNERSRMVTYHKRKKGLTKKASEFHILCDVDACVIIFGPKISNRPVDVETWPKDRNEVRRIINKFRAKATERKKTQDLSDFFFGRKKKVDEELVKLRRAYLEAKFPVWDHRLNTYRLQDLKMLAKGFEERLEAARNRIMTLKGHQFWPETLTAATAGRFLGKNHNQMSSVFTNAMIQKNIEMEQHGFQLLKPLDIQFPACYQPDQSLQQMVPFNVNPTNNPMMFMMMNDDFNPKTPCPPLLNGPVYYNCEPASEVVGNWVVNNPVQQQHHPISYYGPRRQAMMGCRQGPMMQNGSAQICYPQFSDFCEINENDQINKREVLGGLRSSNFLLNMISHVGGI